jgi:chaperonin GroES
MAFKGFSVTFNNVLVEPEVMTKSKGGIIIPDRDQDKQRPVIGTIVGIGPGAPDKSGVFQKTTHGEGQRILFAQYPRTDVELDGKVYYAVQESQILGVYTGEGK